MIDVDRKAVPGVDAGTRAGQDRHEGQQLRAAAPAGPGGDDGGRSRPDGSPVHGRWHIYPEMAAAGLWTTPTDLAKFAIEIALSKNGKSNRVLSETMTRQMLTPVIDEVALGFFLDKDNPGQFGHNGADYGFQALLTMNADTGQGAGADGELG